MGVSVERAVGVAVSVGPAVGVALSVGGTVGVDVSISSVVPGTAEAATISVGFGGADVALGFAVRALAIAVGWPPVKVPERTKA